MSALNRWWEMLRRNEKSAATRRACAHEFHSSERAITLDGRKARIVSRICPRCGEDRTVTQWLDPEPLPETKVTVTFTRREFDAVLRAIPRRYGAEGLDLADARARMEQADRPLRVVS